MALRTIRIQGDPVLTKKCREITEITPKIRELAEDMLDTMYEANGVGLAGPQVGVLKRIVVIDIGEGPVVMINPVIAAICILLVLGILVGSFVARGSGWSGASMGYYHGTC